MSDHRKEAEDFMEKPETEQRAEYNNLPKEVKQIVRKKKEGDRGIAHREDGGKMVLTKDKYVSEIIRKTQKLADLPRRQQNLTNSIAELKKQLVENYGEESLQSLEALLANPE